MARPLDDDETRAFLSEGIRTAKLAWVTKSGRPAVTPVWFVVDDERPPFSLVRLDGRVELSDDPQERLAFATRIGGRYMGADLAEEFGARNGGDDEWLVRFRPERITAVTDVAGY
jgi:hypothetical protein